jgi:multiple sugar transport system ATP-binding protein
MPVMNFFDAELKREGNNFFVELSGVKVKLDEKKTARLLKNNVQSQSITLGVRPEHTDLNANGIDATVDVSEMMGSSVHLHVSAGKSDVIIIVPTIDMKKGFNIGDTVHFGFGGNVVHMFSKETTKNLEF